MPNHITTVVCVIGDMKLVKGFIRSHISHHKKDGRDIFDFETIIPMPQCVKDTIRDFSHGQSVSDYDLDVYAKALMTDDGRSLAVVSRPPQLPPEVLRVSEMLAWYDRTNPEVSKYARRALRCAAETDYPGWFSWSCANWGTKWDAYDYVHRASSFAKDGEPGRFDFEFQTAWAFPRPVFEKLADLWPTLLMEIESIDEGGCEYVGRYQGATKEFKCVPDDDARYLRVYGRERNSAAPS